MNTALTIQRSQRSECDQLNVMQHASMRELGQSCYDQAVIEAYLTHIGTMDESLIDDGTFFSARIGRVLVASGGWTNRPPSYAAYATDSTDWPTESGATIRSVFVHPAWARRGIGRRVMTVVEDDILASGYHAAALCATLTGIQFYRQVGYHGQQPVALKLPEGMVLIGLRMDKQLISQEAVCSHAV